MKKLIIFMLVFTSLSVAFGQSYVLSKNSWHIYKGYKEWGSLKNYRNDFVLLIKELAKKEYRYCKVLGTFDSQTFSWWVAFNQGYSYAIDPFSTAVSTSEIESRLISLCKIVGMSASDFKNFLNWTYVYIFWLNCAQYQASSLYTFAPISDYDEDKQEIIRASNIDPIQHLIIPNSEQARLVNRYLNEGVLDNTRLDFIILTNNESLESFAPALDKFTLTYKNSTFRVWRKAETSVVK